MKELEKIEKIKELLSEICRGYTNDEKRNLLKVLGFKEFKEISELSEDSQKKLINVLEKKIKKEYVTVTLNNGLIVHRPKSGIYSVRDISFTYSSWESKRKQKSYKERYGNNT